MDGIGRRTMDQEMPLFSKDATQTKTDKRVVEENIQCVEIALATSTGQDSDRISEEMHAYKTTLAQIHSERLKEREIRAKSMASTNRQRKNRPKTEAQEKATSANLLALLKSQQYECATCGTALTPKLTQLDHKQPRSDGGTDDISNLQWLCKHCNRAKGELSHGAFIAMCQRISSRF